MLQSCGDSLAANETLVMFPEGTRSVLGRPLDFRLGAAEVASTGGRLIQPVFISCTPPTLAKGQPWYRVPARKPHFKLSVQPPLEAAILAGAVEGFTPNRRVLNAALADLFTVALVDPGQPVSNTTPPAASLGSPG
jgi:1-acyl-sn-glycerol-3-phosphate acyltransferase